jgi:hypothetical protein
MPLAVPILSLAANWVLATRFSFSSAIDHRVLAPIRKATSCGSDSIPQKMALATTETLSFRLPFLVKA